MSALAVALLLVGASLLIAEAHVVSYGLLGVSGLAALIAGVALAVDGAGGGIALVIAVSLVLALVGGCALVYLTREALAVARRRPRSGREALLGRTGVMRGTQVFVDGALWRMELTADDGEPPPADGERVVVEQVRGLTLGVRRAEEWEVGPW